MNPEYKKYVKYGDQILIYYGDFHTHTTYSLHAMSSPSEMVEEAINIGLKYLAITDHHMTYYTRSRQSDYFNRKNQAARAYEINRSFARFSDNGTIKVIPGFEYNLFTTEIDPSFVGDDIPHLRNIGYHSWYKKLENTTINEYLYEIERRFATGFYKILVHPERDIDMLGKNCEEMDIDNDKNLRNLMHEICELCDKYKIIIECNNSSLSDPLISKEKKDRNIKRMKTWIRGAQLHGLNIAVNSDAHVKYDVANCYEAFKLLESMGVNKRSIVNFDTDMIEDLIVPK